jgi:geranylgeranyl reductase family protein
VSSPIIEEAEIAVVGGGPAGSIAAFTLAAEGHDVVLLEQHLLPRDKACGDGLTSSAGDFLAELGLGDVLSDAYAIEGARLIVDWQTRETRRKAGQMRGCCLPRLRLDKALLDHAADAGTRVLHARVTGPLLADGRVRGLQVVGAHGHAVVLAAHIIAADGATSRLRRELLGDTRASAAIAYAARRYVQTDRELDRVFEIYAPVTAPHAGYGWVFPVSEQLANVGIGYMTARGLPRALPITKLLDSFLASLRTHRGLELGVLAPLGAASGAPLGIGFAAERCQIRNVTFVGDAARTCDPITGEGIDQAIRSAHICALGLHRSLKRNASPASLGRSVGRSNLRLSQDSAMVARFGHRLFERHQSGESDTKVLLDGSTPLLAAVGGMVLADVDYPAMAGTPAGQLASELGYGELVRMLDDRIRDEIACAFMLAPELLLREVCAGNGPIGAVALLASHTAGSLSASGQAVVGAISVEVNNALAVMIADHALAHASSAAAELGPPFAELLAEAIEAGSESVALLACDRLKVDRPVRRYLQWARLSGGINLSLAARIGARLSAADDSVTGALGAAGEDLGVAIQICEDIMALSRPDPVTGRQPRRALEEGDFTLPVIFALAEAPHLASLLVGSKSAAEWDELVAEIRQGQGMKRAAETCEEHATRAHEAIVKLVGSESPLVTVCDLPLRCAAAVLAPPAAELEAEPVSQSSAPMVKPRAADSFSRNGGGSQ